MGKFDVSHLWPRFPQAVHPLIHSQILLPSKDTIISTYTVQNARHRLLSSGRAAWETGRRYYLRQKCSTFRGSRHVWDTYLFYFVFFFFFSAAHYDWDRELKFTKQAHPFWNSTLRLIVRKLQIRGNVPRTGTTLKKACVLDEAIQTSVIHTRLWRIVNKQVWGAFAANTATPPTAHCYKFPFSSYALNN